MTNTATETLSVVAKRTSKKPAKVAEEVAGKRVAAKVAKPRKTAPKSQSRKVAKPALLAGGNPQIAKAYGDARMGEAGQPIARRTTVSGKRGCGCGRSELASCLGLNRHKAYLWGGEDRGNV